MHFLFFMRSKFLPLHLHSWWWWWWWWCNSPENQYFCTICTL